MKCGCFVAAFLILDHFVKPGMALLQHNDITVLPEEALHGKLHFCTGDCRAYKYVAVFGSGFAVEQVPQRIFKAVADDYGIAALGIGDIVKMQQLDTSVFLRKYRECFFKDTNLKEYVVR